MQLRPVFSLFCQVASVLSGQYEPPSHLKLTLPPKRQEIDLEQLYFWSSMR